MDNRYQALGDEIAKAKYSDKTDAEIIDALNAETVEYHIEPATSDLDNYLSTTMSETPGLTLKGCLYPVYRAYDQFPAAVCAAAEQAIDLGQGQIQNVNLHGNPLYAQLLAGLVQAGVWTQQEADAILNFGRRYRSIAAELGFTAIAETDLARARNNEDEQALDNLLLHNAAKANSIAGSLNLLLEQIAAGESVEVPTIEDLAAQYGEVE